MGALWLAAALTVLVAGCALAPQMPAVTPVPEGGTPRAPASTSDVPTPSARFTVVVARSGDSFASLAQKYLNDPSLGWLVAEVNGGVFPEPGGTVVIPLVPLARGGLTVRGYQTVPVLCYHKFAKTRGDLMTVTEKAFEEQMRFLKENGYHVLTMDDFFDFLDFKNQIPKKSVVITIDDGWRSAYEIAFPILKRYGYPATMFVYTDFIVGGSKAMDWGMVKEMARNGIDIQCHTKSHRPLDKRAESESPREYFEAIQRELTESSRIIKGHLGTPVKYLAYPYRDTNNLVIALLEKLGFRGAFTVTRGSDPFFVHPYRIGRSMIYGTFDLEDFKSNLKVSDDEALRWK
jgi:peptidoglycan/xylan/chitin deacetylase (PgdA/CDA1 family)